MSQRSATADAPDGAALARHLDIERTVNRVLRRSVNGVSARELAETTLDEILSIDWLCFESRGALLLTDPDRPDELVMEAARGLPGDLERRCARVPFGHCLCGEAAATGEVVYAHCVDERHRETQEADHGHYCVPIALDGTVLGVMNLYLRPQHERCPTEEGFLQSIADTLAGVLRRDRERHRLAESEGQLAAILEAFDGLMYVCTPDMRVEYMNDRFKRLIECERPEGRVCYEVIHARQDPCPWCENDRVFAGDTVRWEVRLKQDGRYYMVVNRPLVHADGRISKLSMSTDITERRRAERELERLVGELGDVVGGVVNALASTTSQRDPYTALHQERVARLATAIAEDLGMTQEEIDGLRVAALLHDIGKISVPSEILSKPGALNDMEMGIVKSHPTVGFELLEHVAFRQPVAQAVLQHHERLDGTGYPDGLHGEDLLIEARILAVADVVEAMASHRPYRPALGVDAALSEIVREAGTKYDEEIVDACVRVIESGGIAL